MNGARTTLLQLVTLTLALQLATPGRAGANPHLARAKQLLDRFKERQALRALKRAGRWRRNTPALRAEVQLYRGIALFNLLSIKGAKRAFTRALTLDREVSLPVEVSPKIRRFFERIRAKLPPAKALPPPPAEDPPPVPAADPDGPQLSSDGKRPGHAKGRPARRPKATRLDRGRDAPPSAARGDSPPPAQTPARQGGTINWGGWLSLAAATTAAGVGVGFGLAARSAQDDADDLSVPWAAADVHHRNALDRALIANVLFGVAGAAAIASAVFFIAGGDKGERAKGVSADLGPTRGGLFVRIGGPVPW